MNKLLLLLCFLLSQTIQAAPAAEKKTTPPEYGYIPPAITAAGATALYPAGSEYALSKVNTKHIKGSIGEQIATKAITQDFLAKGNWYDITPRSGPQGFDHLVVKVNKNGIPIYPLVGESKFGSSKLGFTKDGKQMSPRWVKARFRGLSTQYATVHQTEKIQTHTKLPLNPRHHLSIVTGDNKVIHFWQSKNPGNQTWYSNATQAELTQAKKLAEEYSKFFKAAGNGLIEYKSRLFHIAAKGNDLVLNIYDGNNMQHGTKPMHKPIILKNALISKLTGKEIRDALAKGLQPHFKSLTENQLKYLANKLQKQYTAQQLIQQRSLLASNVKALGMNSVAAGAIPILINLCTTGEVDWRDVSYSIGSATAAFGSSIAINTLMTKLGASAALNSTLSAASAYGMGGVAYAAILYATGDIDSAQAAQIGGASMAGGIAAAAVNAGLMALPSAIGATSGTGTAIASLGGAAAKNATLAYLGGGTVASGGGGMALGTLVTGGAVAVAAIAVTYGVMKICEIYDDNDQIQYYQLMLRELSAPQNNYKTLHDFIDNQ